MRRYLSLGSALMMGVVIAKKEHTSTTVSKAKNLFDNVKLDAPIKITTTHVAKKNENFRETSPQTSIAASSENTIDGALSNKTTSSAPNVKQLICGVGYYVHHG